MEDFPIDDFELSTTFPRRAASFPIIMYFMQQVIIMEARDVGHYDAFIDVSGVHSIYAFSFIAFGQETADRTI